MLSAEHHQRPQYKVHGSTLAQGIAIQVSPCPASSLLPGPLCHLICPSLVPSAMPGAVTSPAAPALRGCGGARLVQKGTELWRPQKDLSTARTPGEPSSASWEWGDAVQLRLQPDFPQQQLPAVPSGNHSSSVLAQGEVCPGPGERHRGC